MPQMFFPKGPKPALVSSGWTLSFDDLHQLRFLIRAEMSARFETRPLRILGCLKDDEASLLALLFVTELFDYMPINPNLTDVEIARIVETAGVDAAVVSADFLNDKGHLFTLPAVINWDDVVSAALQSLANENVRPNDKFGALTGRLILHTSGSTGHPKRVPISISAINASAKNIADGHQLTANDHALNALPTFHIGALVDVLLAPLSVSGAVSITDKRSPTGLADELIATRPTWIQIVPTILRRMVEDLDQRVIRDAGSSLGFIRSIAAPVPPDLKLAAERLFGCPVIEMYGMTETAGQIATNGRDQDAVKPGSVGKPVGVDVAILDGFANPVEAGKTGEVCVAGPSVFAGYEGMIKDDVFFGDWFRTGDLGLLDGDGHLFLRGRLKEMINVGGEKVSPHEIEMAVVLMPEVIEAAAYAVPHPTLGEQVGLTVATRTAIDAAQIRRFLDSRLADFKRPNHIAMLDQLPRLANSKVDRVLLKRDGARAWSDRLGGTTGIAAEPPTPEAAAVTTHWMQILKCRAPEGDDDFFDMGGDSLGATQLLLGLEAALGRQISPGLLFERPTFAGLVAALSDTGAQPSQDEHAALRFVREKTAGWPGQIAVPHGLLRGMGSLKSGHPLFWASQNAQENQATADTLGQSRPYYATRSLGSFKGRIDADFKVLARQLADEINTIQPEGPIALGGFCGGAWVMHHTAERLIEMGRDIRIFLSFDYWPERAVLFPTLHVMSTCNRYSGREQYARHHLADRFIHPNGTRTLEVDSRHRFEAVDLAPHMSVLNGYIDGDAQDFEPPVHSSRHWDIDARLRPPEAEMRALDAPRAYRKGETRRLRLVVKNTSDQVWERTDLSGLSVQVALVNLDKYIRTPCAGFAFLDQAVAPGEEVELTLDITFPDRRVPIWLSWCLVSQGLTRFRSKASGAGKLLVWPDIFAR